MTEGEAAAQGTEVATANRQRYVIHLTVTSRDLPAAQRLALALARSLRFMPELSPGETTVSEEDDQGVHHRVFCDRLLDGGRRCPLKADHVDACPVSEAR